MKRRSKVVALSTAAVCVLVLVVAAFAAKDRIREEWYLRQLNFGGAAHREMAASRLADMKSAKSIPQLISLLREGTGARRETDEYDTTNMFCMRAIRRIGKPALPAVIKTYADEASQHSSAASGSTFELRITRILWSLYGVLDRKAGPSYWRAITVDVLHEVALNEQECPEIRQAAADALRAYPKSRSVGPRPSERPSDKERRRKRIRRIR